MSMSMRVFNVLLKSVEDRTFKPFCKVFKTEAEAHKYIKDVMEGVYKLNPMSGYTRYGEEYNYETEEYDQTNEVIYEDTRFEDKDGRTYYSVIYHQDV